jgi:hypothetical protein
MHTSNAMRNLLLGIVGLGVASIWPARAAAEEIFPGVIAKDANMPCAPTCTLCHTSNPGRADTWPGKKFGFFIGTHGAIKGVPSSVTTAFNAYKATAATDPTVATALMALQNGIDPDNGESLCGATYGCGAHVAKKLPPSDVSVPLWALGAVIAGGILRRRRKPNAR